MLQLHELKKKHSKHENHIDYLETYDKAKAIDFGLTPAQQIVFDFITRNHYDTEKYFTLAEALG